MLIVKSWLVWHHRKTFVPNAIPPKNFGLVDLGLIVEKVLNGTAFFAWWLWLMTWWSAMVLKDSSALCISHNKDPWWWVGSWSKGWSWTFWLFLDTWGPTHAYQGGLPKSVRHVSCCSDREANRDFHRLEVPCICYWDHNVQRCQLRYCGVNEWMGDSHQYNGR